MAKKEHLDLIKQGVEVWNKWREDDTVEKPDLSRANLDWAYLYQAKLSGANLSGANLIEADLVGADLSSAELSGADLIEADLAGADLSSAYLFRADLSDAKLGEADLSGADLSKANLDWAYLYQAKLSGAKLSKARLSKADLSWADLRGADLSWANLIEANLSGADLRGANLVWADLRGANITGSRLYGTARDDWKIDRLICDYVFWDERAGILNPKDRDFEPGEFEELYKQLPTIEYYFDEGFTPLDAIVMDQVVLDINKQNPEFELKLDSFHSRGKPRGVFTILHKKYAEEAISQIQEKYEGKIEVLKEALKGERDRLDKFIAKIIEEPKITIGAIIGAIRGLEIGDRIKIESKGDVAFAKDQVRASVVKFTNQAAESLYNKIAKAIQKSDGDLSDKEDAQEQLNKIAHELQESEPNKGRLERCWDYIGKAMPEVAKAVPWKKLIEKALD